MTTTADLSKDLSTYMNKSEFLSKLGWNGVKAFATSILIVFAFIKLIELDAYYGHFLSIGQFIIFFACVMGVYYYYFWNEKETKTHELRFRNKDRPFTWKDFFYTDKINSDQNFISLIVSWIGGGLAYIGIVIIALIVKSCIEGSNTEVTMSTLRIIAIGLIATAIYIYTQRYVLNEKFWETIALCTLYGFGLSICAYILGMIIGISNMVFGLPITIAILALQFVFTSAYTYMDLLEWSKNTHIRIIRDNERAAAEAAKKAEEIKIDAV